MKKVSLSALRRISMVLILGVVGALIGFSTYLYVAYYGPLTGDITAVVTPDLLSNLQTKKFDLAVERLKKRQSLPDIPASLPDTYASP